ncbi:uncharacterized protein LOC106458635 [Limulus polyphemus]|uniref:Uncharacterized protein LOC106458635 n=1 Tax=Limulus polyphemus TaxID=6850 RepID=A0ABM1B2R9_LIMPO|nr:uncharacterized protein LOC106458635 [Limulus polyphemus]
MSEIKPGPKREGTLKVISKEDSTATNKNDQVLADGNGTVDGPAAKKTKLVKDHTMAETAAAGKQFLGKEVLEESRSLTRAIRDTAKVTIKRLDTMTITAKEGEALLKNLSHPKESSSTGKRKTRSQTRGGDQQSPSSESKKLKKETTKPNEKGKSDKEDDEDIPDSKEGETETKKKFAKLLKRQQTC